MQNLKIKNKYLLIENKNQIKKLWLENFSGDTENTVDNFSDNVFENKKGVGVFCKNELIAMMLFLNSKIIYKNKITNAVYFYAVCTDKKFRNQGIMKQLFEFAKECAEAQGFEICFLVPENEELFRMYEKFTFKRTISFEEKVCYRENFGIKKTMYKTTEFCYDDYIRIRNKASENSSLVIWNEDEFKFIFNKNRDDVNFIFMNLGYAIYEKQNDQILVYELCGDEIEVLNSIFDKEKDFNKIKLRIPHKTKKTDFGMTYNLVDFGDQIDSIYFGMPYG